MEMKLVGFVWIDHQIFQQVRSTCPNLDWIPCAFFETIANQDEENPCELYQLQRGTCCTMPEVLPTAPANLAELCDADSVAADLGAFLACANACVEASCCEDSCSTNPVCFQYFPCLVLDSIEPPETDPTTTEGPPSPPSNLADCVTPTLLLLIQELTWPVQVLVLRQAVVRILAVPIPAAFSTFLV